MQYVNFVNESGDEETLYTAPVPASDAAYLRQATLHLKPLSDEEYMTGPATILHTLAKFGYVLDGKDLYWCIEWPPGFLVVKMVPEKELQWVALRSPVPNFGGRVPLPEDGDPNEYDGDNNPQYNLIFDSWDAQFDEQDREWRKFVPADTDVQSRFKNALGRVNALSEIMQSCYTGNSKDWFQRCKQNLEKWCGQGLRLKPTT